MGVIGAVRGYPLLKAPELEIHWDFKTLHDFFSQTSLAIGSIVNKAYKNFVWMQIHTDVIGRIESKQSSMHMCLSLVLFFISTSLRVDPFRCFQIVSSLFSYFS